MPAGNDSASTFAHLEQRVTYLLERLEASADQRASVDFGPVEDGLQDILRHLEQQHGMFAALSENSRGAAQPADSGLIEVVKRELSDIRFNQTEADRHTQDSLEAVHNTLGHVVDRLAMIEGGLREVRAVPGAPSAEPPPLLFESAPPPPMAPRPQMEPQPKPELPNPAAARAHFDAAPREFQAMPAMAGAALVTPHAISAILATPSTPVRSRVAPELPPAHP